MSVEAILNFVRIDDQVLLGGQPTAGQFEAARDEGVEVVINLAPTDPQKDVSPDEGELLASLGVDYHHIPVAWTAPTLAQYAQFVRAMEGLDGRKVLIHCAANYRVTAFFSRYAMKTRGWTAAQADELVTRIWTSNPNYGLNEVWRDFMSKVEAA